MYGCHEVHKLAKMSRADLRQGWLSVLVAARLTPCNCDWYADDKMMVGRGGFPRGYLGPPLCLAAVHTAAVDLVCSARGCRAEARWALRWNNPKLHPPERLLLHRMPGPRPLASLSRLLLRSNLRAFTSHQ